jgi:hypothetical protein
MYFTSAKYCSCGKFSVAIITQWWNESDLYRIEHHLFYVNISYIRQRDKFLAKSSNYVWVLQNAHVVLTSLTLGQWSRIFFASVLGTLDLAFLLRMMAKLDINNRRFEKAIVGQVTNRIRESGAEYE